MRLRDFSRITAAELRGDASEEEADWLRSRALLPLWQRELHEIMTSIKFQIGERRRLLAPLKPLPGESPTDYYLKAKAEFDRWYGRTLRVHRAIEERLREASNLMQAEGLDMLHDTAVSILLSVLAVLEEGRPDDAHRLIISVLEKWGKQESVFVSKRSLG